MCSSSLAPRVALALLMSACGSPDGSQSFDETEIGQRTDIVGELDYGRTHVDTLAVERWHGLTFHAEAGDVLSAYATSVPRYDAARDPSLLLYGPVVDEPPLEPRAIAEDIRAEDRKNAHILDHVIEEPGSYLLLVGDASGGDYRVRLACTGGSCASGWLDDGDEPCATSALGHSVLEAALAAEQSRNTVPASLMSTHENRAAAALVTGPVIFPAMADAIALAEHEIDLAMFVYDYSDAYEEITDGLARLEARRIAEGGATPVLVRILVDAQKILFNTGSKIAARAFDGIADLRLDPDHVQVQIATYEHFTLGNLHSKLVVVDGKVVMLGGANIQKQHDYEMPWMDSFYLLEGRSAQTFLADFDHAWNMSAKWYCARDEKDAPSCQRWDDAPPAWHAAEVLEPDFGSMELDCVPAIALNRTAWGGFNNNIDNPMDQGILAAMDGAQQRIRMQTPNLNDDAVKDAILRAVARGVELEILLSLGFNDLPMHLFGGTNEENVASLLARADAETPAQAHKLQFRWYSEDGIVALDGNVPGASHLKYLSIDGQMVIVGSTNMDTLAWNHSREANVAIDRASITRAWDAQVFEPNWQRALPAAR